MKMTRIRKSGFLSDCRGLTILEFALIAPLLLMLTIGIIDFGLLFWSEMTLTRAASAAARCFALDQTHCNTAGAAQTYGGQQAWGLTGATFTASTPACGMQVQATLNYNFVSPWWPGTNPLPLAATACYPKQY
jgi:Flp pilus assembly protein TadG